ncbi:hypothetical protein COT82_01745, partial [Candidatus Campbellbacteria bacterium CG10_big_fil_rev_8_21_14_0_10_35_52]
MSDRTARISELIKKLAAEFLSKEADRSSIITVTRANISKDLKNATIYLTIYPQASEKSALNFAKRKRTEFKKYAREKIRIKRIPS